MINIGSVTSEFGYAGLAPYTASRKRSGRRSGLPGIGGDRYITGQTILVDGGISTGATKATVAKK